MTLKVAIRTIVPRFFLIIPLFITETYLPLHTEMIAEWSRGSSLGS